MAITHEEGSLFDIHHPDKSAYKLPPLEVPSKKPTKHLRESTLGLPQVSEMDVVRHYTRLSNMNYSIDAGMYPLGSCTMKYNPKINDEISMLDGFKNIHPYQPLETAAGAIEVMGRLQDLLAEVTGLPAVSLQPAAGAHGEFTGVKVMRAYLKENGGVRRKMLIPDTAHGTNPATSTLCQYEVVRVPNGPNGYIEASDVERLMDRDTAGIMVTNPNTLGLFEKNIVEICKVVHAQGGLVYCDGANFNAVMGWSRPGDLGIDVMHLNLHKTFSTPHGGGGPGAGPICAVEKLRPYLPSPQVVQKDGAYALEYNLPKTIGRVRMAYGNFLVLVRALVYGLTLGRDGLKEASTIAVVNANYILNLLKADYHLPFGPTCLHECVFSDKNQNEFGVKTMEIAKR
ncbi:MAG TPA: aminomethyl-transferring glycine dehydrogenase subunit GcvPB, partial [Oligoflexia bacterium]|nr:aminomethyl-transferring glycine dehydrogenase subunit GcvPB [Oligoflexia bacterium]